MIAKLIASGLTLALNGPFSGSFSGSFNGRCLTLDNGKPEECRQYFNQTKAATAALKGACSDSRYQKTRKRRWSDHQPCGKAVVGTCRIVEGDKPQAPVTERIYMRPTEDSTAAKCLTLQSPAVRTTWIPMDR